MIARARTLGGKLLFSRSLLHSAKFLLEHREIAGNAAAIPNRCTTWRPQQWVKR